jgi:hypothetical protein
VLEQELDRFDQLQPTLAAALRAKLHESLGNEIGILSLSETPTSDQMWALYASDHRGFVIGFDDSNSFFHAKRSETDEFYHLRKVNYVDHRLNFESFEELTDAEIFTTKLNGWSFEREWRMLVPLLNRNAEITEPEPIHLIPIPKSSIQCIILGYKSDTKLRDSIAEVLDRNSEYRNVAHFKAFVDLERGNISISRL